MTKITQGMLAAVAISLSLGAVAWGRDHVASPQTTGSSNASEAAINRAAKADRETILAEAGQSRTISLRLDALANTSVLIRIPVAREARNSPAPLLKKSGDRKVAVACEPPVSVLSEVAKLMQPGRCVT